MIVPCGIKGCRMGSIKEILQKASDGRGIDETSRMDQAYNSLIKEFAEVFKLSLDHIHSPNWRLQQSNGFN
jgi:lipoyl(octanoyl) transferase